MDGVKGLCVPNLMAQIPEEGSSEEAASPVIKPREESALSRFHVGEIQRQQGKACAARPLQASAPQVSQIGAFRRFLYRDELVHQTDRYPTEVSMVSQMEESCEFWYQDGGAQLNDRYPLEASVVSQEADEQEGCGLTSVDTVESQVEGTCQSCEVLILKEEDPEYPKTPTEYNGFTHW